MNQFIQIVIGGLLQGSVFAVVALGFSLVYRVTGVINLSQGAFCIVGALMMYSLEVDLGLPAPLAFVGAVLGTGMLWRSSLAPRPSCRRCRACRRAACS